MTTDLLNIKQVAGQLGCCQRMVQILVVRGELPAPLRLGRLVRWRAEDIAARLEALALAAQGGQGAVVTRRTGRPRSTRRGV